MFMHGGWMHLIGNMLYLWVFGNNVEDAMGHVRFIVFYLLCGTAAVFAQALPNPESTVPMIGASGAISGVLGAYLMGLAFGGTGFSILAYLAGATFFGISLARYLHIPSIPSSSELVILCASIIGAGVGFLWYNTFPAQVFMGDVGSQALGGAMAALALLTNTQLLLVVLGGLYGFFTYATYELTNYALIRNWPVALVPVDIAWGVVLCTIVSAGGYSVGRWLQN